MILDAVRNEFVRPKIDRQRMPACRIHDKLVRVWPFLPAFRNAGTVALLDEGRPVDRTIGGDRKGSDFPITVIRSQQPASERVNTDPAWAGTGGRL